MIKDIIIINNFYGFCSFLLYNHTLNNINSISLLLFWCEIVCYKTQIIVYFFWGTVRMPLFVREIWRHSHYISPNFGCVLLIVLRFFGWSPNLILLSIRYILYPLALLGGDSEEIGSKKALMGALKLYLDFINLFILLLQLFGQRR